MVSVIKRKKGNNYYYTLIHNTGNHQHEKYLGKTIPENISEIKRNFLLIILRNKWNIPIDKIKTEYTKQPKLLIKKQLKEFSIGFTHNSQKIEGSTLSKKETYDLLKFSLTPHHKSESDMIETQSHHKVYLKIIKKLPPLTNKVITSWHKEMFEKTMPEFAGKIRTYPVFITDSDSKFPHPKFVAQFISEFFKWYKKSGEKIKPVELAGIAHFRLVNIHQFGDGNGRISRLLMNYILIKNNYPPLNIKFTDRENYYKALEKGNLESDEIHFLKWFMKYYIKSNVKYL
jgi:Fic family protein